MSDSRSPIADSFNARFMDSKQVGSSFVLSPFLEKAIAPENTAILGPRGSGKTTLLKMLTLPALLNWNDPRRDKIARALDYLSVYVPYSLTWSAEYRGFTNNQIPADVESLLSVSLFRHGLLLSLLETWKECSRAETSQHPELKKFFFSVDDTSEARLARHLAKLWQLEIPISTLNGIKEGISQRIRTIQRLNIAASLTKLDIDRTLESHQFLGAHYLDDAAAFADFLSEHYSFNKKIALCFDELEIASDVIASSILRAPRSVDPRFLIKFCAAPFVGAASILNDANIATQGNDYSLIFLSSFSTSDTRDFSEALFQAICSKYRVKVDHNSLLGPSLVDDAEGLGRLTGKQSELSKYGPDGSYQRKFRRLYSIDDSFRSFIDGHTSIDIENLSKGTENQRAAIIRKIIWPVLVREEFLFFQEAGDNGEVQRRRLRSKDPVSDIYTGAASIFAICEGNPRSLIGLLEPMIEEYARGSVSKGGAIRRSMQKRLIDNLIAAYFALLSTVPSAQHSRRITSLLDLVYVIGEHFRESILGSKFNPDPVLSFFVDERISKDICSLVGKGINLGAFITTNEVRSRANDHFKVGEIAGLKVRLSNIFAPRFKLPLVGGRTINLSTVLQRTRSDELNPVFELFGEKI